MKNSYYVCLLLPLLLVSCATVERDVRISVRDAESKSAVDNGTLIFDRPSFSSWYFSLDPVRSQKFKINDQGTASIDDLKDVVWSMKADVSGYDPAVSVFSLPEVKQLGPENWRKMAVEQKMQPESPGKQLEYRIEIAGDE
ncbi:MAG: hypothetical protein QM496_21900 [Verrucomicrobiota bacterium]